MKKVVSLTLIAILIASCSSSKKEIQVTVTNPSDFNRIEELVEIAIDSLQSKIVLADSQVYVVKNGDGEVIPSQITYDGKLLFPAGVKANETLTYTISAGNVQDFPAKTYARFIKERKDDFAWENDRVAFRIYGPSLIPIDGPSNGLDIWYKRTNDLIIDNWYKNDLAGVASYHKDSGEGLDDYKVGRSLGAGAMAPFVKGKLWLNSNFVSQEILDNGPLRSTFKLTYDSFDVDGKNINETRLFSLDAGSQLTKVTEDFSFTEPVGIAAGIAKRDSGNTIVISPEKDYLAYLEPSPNAGNVYVSLLFPSAFDSTFVNSYDNTNAITKKQETHKHVLAFATYQPNKPYTYYTGYGWEKFGYPTIADYEKYLNHFSKALKQPLTVTLK